MRARARQQPTVELEDLVELPYELPPELGFEPAAHRRTIRRQHPVDRDEIERKAVWPALWAS